MYKIFSYLLSPILVLIAGCGKTQVSSKAYSGMLYTLLSHTVEEISIETAVNKKDSALFLDARAINEYNVSHIINAMHVDYDNFNIKSVEDIDKNQEIIIYCSVGYRSEKIAEKLIVAGYNNVSNLYGGIFEWINQGQPVYANNVKTNKVHAFDKTWGVWLEKGEKVY